MILVLEESEDISLELLTPLLASVKKDNEVSFIVLLRVHFTSPEFYPFADIFHFQEVLPVARKLAERVLESCSTKVKPYLIQAAKTLGISFDDYSKVVGSICQETSETDEQNEVNATAKDMVISFDLIFICCFLMTLKNC